METDNYGRPLTPFELWLDKHASALWLSAIAALSALGIALTATVMSADHCGISPHEKAAWLARTRRL